MQSSGTSERNLSENDKSRLDSQNSRLVPEFKAKKFQTEAQKHWDIFYKRNTTKFFKDRHWTTREFQELAQLQFPTRSDTDTRSNSTRCTSNENNREVESISNTSSHSEADKNSSASTSPKELKNKLSTSNCGSRSASTSQKELENKLSTSNCGSSAAKKLQNCDKIILEVGCGVGNFIFPLIQEFPSDFWFAYACDFSPRAVQMVKDNPLYDQTKIKAFQCDITSNDLAQG